MHPFHDYSKRGRRTDQESDPAIAALLSECDAKEPHFNDQKARRCLVAFHENERAAELQPVVNGNIRLILKLAHVYASDAVPLTDLLQEGVIGFISGLKKFDLGRPEQKPVANYAAMYARKGMLQYLDEMVRIVSIGRRSIQAANKAMRMVEREIAAWETTDMPFDLLLQDATRTVRLGALDVFRTSERLDEDNEAVSAIYSQVEDGPAPDDLERLYAACGTLNALDRDLLYAYFGMDGCTFEEVCERRMISKREGKAACERLIRFLQHPPVPSVGLASPLLQPSMLDASPSALRCRPCDPLQLALF